MQTKSRQREVWGIDGVRQVYEAQSEALHAYLKDKEADSIPVCVKLQRYKRVYIPVGFLTGHVLDYTLESINAAYGQPGKPDWTRTDKMKNAEAAFIQAVLEDYVPWSCVEADGPPEMVCTLSWIRRHRPGWLEERDG